MRALIEHRVVAEPRLQRRRGHRRARTSGRFPAHDPLLALIAHERPPLYAGLRSTRTPRSGSARRSSLLNVVASLVYIFVARLRSAGDAAAAAAVSRARARATDLFLVLGEQHHRTVARTRAARPRGSSFPSAASTPAWSSSAPSASGKTSACMYPYVEQLLAYRADDPARKVAGLVLEVKGDFCRHVRDILERHGRADDYVEVSLDSPYRYNPLHNDLDAYALAYGIATLMTNLFGRGKEPFWQQASTNLVKFVILLHQMLDDYVTLFQVYEHVINPDKLRARIAEGERALRRAATGASSSTSASTCFTTALTPWTWHDDETGRETWTHWSHGPRRRPHGSRAFRTGSTTSTPAPDDGRQAWRSSRP